jgi:hypothetical protein
MGNVNKIEFAPLFPPGFRRMTIGEVRSCCVDGFPGSRSRPIIMGFLEQVISRITAEKIESDIWLDGSFVTEKLDPCDSDILVVVKSEFVENTTPSQKNVLNWLRGNLKTAYLCDSYILALFPEGHINHGQSQWLHAYWLKQFGFSRGDELKGILVIKTP